MFPQRPILLRSPDDPSGGGPAPTAPTAPDPNGVSLLPNASPSGDPPPAAPAPGPQAGDAHIFLPDDFDAATIPAKFRTEASKLDVVKMLGSYEELEKKLSETQPGPPENYEINRPEIEGLTGEQIKEIIPDDDPLLGHMLGEMKEAGASQKVVDAVIGGFLKFYGQKGLESRAESIKKLGGEEKFTGTMKRLAEFYSNRVSPEAFQVIRSMSTNAQTVLMFQELMGIMSKEPTMAGPTTPVDQRLTEADLRSIMREDAYNSPSDPRYQELRDKVKKGYEALYPTA